MLANLEVLIMPNGEVLCLGKTIGRFKELAQYLGAKATNNKDELRQAFYAKSPFDLASDDDNAYRDMIDYVLDPTMCARCGSIMRALIPAHAHTDEKGNDVTR